MVFPVSESQWIDNICMIRRIRRISRILTKDDASHALLILTSY